MVGCGTEEKGGDREDSKREREREREREKSAETVEAKSTMRGIGALVPDYAFPGVFIGI